MREFVSLTKRYRFSAGHRLYLKGLSDEENMKIFDTCSNPNGHGHDYYVELKIGGDIDPVTGMVVAPGELDRAVIPVLDKLDYKRLDIEVPYFREHQPTGENIARYIWERLEPSLRCRLIHIRVSETDSSYFEYFEEGSYPYECKKSRKGNT
ncbi:MAG: 6-carboxytetrahydropterin synthase [Deltaproteobacteria bacterium]